MLQFTNRVFDEQHFGEYLKIIYDKSSRRSEDVFLHPSSVVYQKAVEAFKSNLIAIAENGTRKVNVFFSNKIITKIGINVQDFLMSQGLSALFDKQTDQGEYWFIFLDGSSETQEKENEGTMCPALNFFQ
jgi:hypothetical protein